MNKPFKLLLIDDDEPVVANLCIFLRDKKYDVTSASDGLEGLKLLETDEQGFDLVITDMIMPQMSGGELFDKLKSLDPDVKILLSSGYSIDGEAREIINRGCKGFIQKPFTLTQFGEKIREVLGAG